MLLELLLYESECVI
uniref:Uncharacterized protein n=1 Tax=Anguilla anguilla TaxID=7936 RepID=A0A0E9Y1B4_ANGAN